MSKITAHNLLRFKSTEELFGNVNEELSSFSEANLLDEGMYFKWVNEILGRLGIAYYSEEMAIIPIVNYKAEIPKNFKTFFAAFSCDYLSGTSSTPSRGRISYYTDITTQDCCIPGCNFVGDPCKHETKVTVEHYIEENRIQDVFSNFQLLTLGNEAIREICDFHGLNRNSYGNPNEIAFSNNHINTNFNTGYIYLFYYGLPVDPKLGLPLIPDIPRVEQALESYILFKQFRKMWLNNESPDLERKVAFLRQEHDDNMSAAFIESNTPTYASMKKRININKRNLQIYLNHNKYEYAW